MIQRHALMIQPAVGPRDCTATIVVACVVSLEPSDPIDVTELICSLTISVLVIATCLPF